MSEETAAANREHAKRIVSAVFAASEADCPMPFALYRHQDVTGTSGTGTVAHGVQFADGTVVIRWRGDNPSTVMWNSLDDAMDIHGHDGRTHVVWLAAEFSEMAKAEEEAAEAVAAPLRAERDKLQQACQTLGHVAELQARDLYAMWIDVSRGDMDAVRESVLNAHPDGDDHEPDEQWNGTETGVEWYWRTKAGS